MRHCIHCGKPMLHDGYVIYDGLAYYCSKECLDTEISDELYEKLYRADMAYWTEFEEEGEDDA